jgi:hypothetical protein
MLSKYCSHIDYVIITIIQEIQLLTFVKHLTDCILLMLNSFNTKLCLHCRSRLIIIIYL